MIRHVSSFVNMVSEVISQRVEVRLEIWYVCSVYALFLVCVVIKIEVGYFYV